MVRNERALVGDIGGTNLRLAVMRIDPETGLAAFERTDYDEPVIEIIPTPQDPEGFYAALAQGAARLVQAYNLIDGAIGFPGPVVDRGDTRFVGPLPNVSLLREPFELEQVLGRRESILRGVAFTALNDAEAATYAAPHVPGVTDPTNQSPILYITQSTGVGGSVIQNGRIAGRLTGQREEFGHTPLLTESGLYVTLEDLVSGPAIEQRFGQNGDSVQTMGQNNNRVYDEAWRRIGREFGRGLATLVPGIGPSDIVIGGGVSRDHRLYEPELQREFKRALSALPPGIVETPKISFVPGDQVKTFGLVGARYAVEQYRRGH